LVFCTKKNLATLETKCPVYVFKLLTHECRKQWLQPTLNASLLKMCLAQNDSGRNE
jgi:hypothetical protein